MEGSSKLEVYQLCVAYYQLYYIANTRELFYYSCIESGRRYITAGNNPKLSNDVLEITPDQSETAYFAQLRIDYILDLNK